MRSAQVYSVTFNVTDNSENPISAATITLQGHGTNTTNASGIAVFEEVDPGTYSYQVMATGFVTASEMVEVTNADVTVNVQMQLPGYYYLEDFSEYPAYGIPEDWTKIVTHNDMIYCANEVAILFRQSSAMNPIILVSPLIDLEPAGELMFDYGDGSGAQGEFGYMTDLSDVNSFVSVLPFNPSSSWKSDTISVSSINGGNGAVYLAWRITSGVFTYFSLDDVRLTYKGDEEAPIFFDDFENYTAGEKLACQNPDDWTTWSQTPCGEDDAWISADQAYSGTNSVKIDGTADVIKAFPNYTNGAYSISFQMYIPQGKNGYFNVLQLFNGSNSKWGLEVYFPSTGIGSAVANGLENEFNFTFNQWFEMKFEVDLNADEASLSHNNTPIYTWQWSKGAQGNDNLCQLGAIGFYAWASGGEPLYYFDDFKVKEQLPLAPPTNLTAEVLNNKDIKLTWQAPSKALKGYNVYRKGQLIAENISGTTFTDYNLTPGKYTYVVRALYDEGLSAGAGPVTATIEGGADRNFVVLEIATGTWCGYCPGASMGAHDLMEQGYDVAVIKYHNGDPFENEYSTNRNNYYGVTGYPTAIFDGIDRKVGGSSNSSLFPSYLEYYENRMEVVSYFTLDANALNTSDNHWSLTVNAEMVYPSVNKDFALHVAITESHIQHNWLNQTEINNTVRMMVPNANGTALNFAGGNTHQVELNFDLSSEYVLENCELIVFLQNVTTKEIVQATKAAMEPISMVEVGQGIISRIYPNPASSFVNVSTNGQNGVLTIMDIQGRVIQSLQLNGTNQLVDISKLTQGMYLFVVKSEQATQTHKVIVK